MTKVIICGAGPIGLYLGIRLKQMGVENILIIDLRAGEYTRPGHLNLSVFQTAEKGLNIKLWPQDKTAHIKDLERKLYEEAKKLGIEIEQKKFVGFINSSERKGIIASDMLGQQTEIECYLAFDCTGLQRELIHAINNSQNEAPFTLKPIIDSNDLLVKKHFLAFVKITNNHHSSLTDSYNFDLKSNPIKYVNYMEKFFKMGWKEFAPPHCYNQVFGKGKICIYVEHPDNLSSDLHASWLQLVLEFYSNDPTISYELCSPPKRGRKKPRFNEFAVVPHELSPLTFSGSNELPTIVAQGDAQIDFHYRLAHGVEHGLERVECFLKNLEIIAGLIYFDTDKVAEDLKSELAPHRNQLIYYYDKYKQRAQEALHVASKHYNEVIPIIKNFTEKERMQRSLKIIEARLSYKFVFEMFELCDFADLSLADLPLLDQINSKLINAYNNLTEYHFIPRSSIQKMILHLAQIYQSLGNNIFQMNNFKDAIEPYKKALELYQTYSENISAQEIAKLNDQLLMLENHDQIPEKEVFSFSNLVSPQFFPLSSINNGGSEESIKDTVPLKFS